jgi:hypothetical protein
MIPLMTRPEQLIRQRIISFFLLFMSMGWDYVSEHQSPTGLLLIPQVIYKNGEPRWNDMDRGEPNDSEKSHSHCHFVHQKSHMV